MTDTKVVTGAGPVGWTVATQLAEAGHHVRVLTRSGSGPEHANVERLRVDASDAGALAAAAEGSDALFHCIHGSSYSERSWRAELPGADQVVLAVAGRIGAVAVFPESLYSYTDPRSPMTEDNPRDWKGGKGGVRADLLRGRAAHATPTVSVVAGDFVGPRVMTSHLGERVVPAVLAGRKVRLLGSLDQPHSWTHVPDLARAMVAASQKQELWNSVLHAPTTAPSTQREMVHAFADAAGVRIPEPGLVPTAALRAIGLFNVQMREVSRMLYQFTGPFVMDSTRSQQLLGLSPTPRDRVAAETVAWWRDR